MACRVGLQARRIEEQQRQNAARAPHRWSQGLKVSVPVDRLETKALEGLVMGHGLGVLGISGDGVGVGVGGPG